MMVKTQVILALGLFSCVTGSSLREDLQLTLQVGGKESCIKLVDDMLDPIKDKKGGQEVISECQESVESLCQFFGDLLEDTFVRDSSGRDTQLLLDHLRRWSQAKEKGQMCAKAIDRFRSN